MFSSILPFAFGAGGGFLLAILLSVVGGIIERSKSLTEVQQAVFGKVILVSSAVLFLVICVSIIPLVLRAFTTLQAAIGAGDRPFVKFFRDNECVITYVVWGLMAIVMAFLGPDMIRYALGEPE